MGPMEGRLAQMMPTPGSMTDQMLALTEVPERVEEWVSRALVRLQEISCVKDSVYDVRIMLAHRRSLNV